MSVLSGWRSTTWASLASWLERAGLSSYDKAAHIRRFIMLALHFLVLRRRRGRNNWHNWCDRTLCSCSIRRWIVACPEYGQRHRAEANHSGREGRDPAHAGDVGNRREHESQQKGAKPGAQRYGPLLVHQLRHALPGLVT